MKQSGRAFFIAASSLVFAFFATMASAQLPEAFNGWESDVVRTISPPQLPQFAKNDADIIQEYGFSSGEYRAYQKKGAGLTVTLWKMNDATAAYGLYSYYREPGTASFDGKDPVAVWPSRLVVQHGPYVVDARGGSFTVGDAKELLARIPKLRLEQMQLPTLPDYFPDKNLVKQSQRYILGPKVFERYVPEINSAAVGFQTGAEAEVAQYSLAGSKPHLLIISYATPQLAIKKEREFAKMKANDGSDLFVGRKGSMVAIVLGAASPDTAKEVLGRIEYQSKVTWSEYVPGPRDNIGKLIINIFVLIGFILLFSLVAGLSFGGLRLFSKRFLRKQLFDRPEEMEIIRLRLSDH